MAGDAYQRDGPPLRPRDRLGRPRPDDGRAAEVRPGDPGRTARHGQDGARHQHRLSTSPRLGAASSSRTGRSRPSTAASSASSRWKCRPNSWPRASSPSRRRSPPPRSAAARSTRIEFDRIVEAAQEMQRIPLYIDQTGGISIAPARRPRPPPEAAARPRLPDHRLSAADPGFVAPLLENRVQEITEITTGLKALAKELNVPILALSQLSRQVEIARRQAPAAFRPARIRLDRAGCRRRAFRFPRGILPEEPRAQGGHGGILQVAGRDGADRTAGRRSSSASSGTARPAPSSLQFDADVTRFSSLAKEDRLPDRYH